MTSEECMPETPESQLAGLNAQVQDNAYLVNLLEQCTPLKPSMNVDALITSLQTTAARQYPLASRGESSFIDLDEVDEKDLEESMVELSPIAMEMRRKVMLKREPVDALQPFSGGYSHVAGSESTVDLKPSVANVWLTTMAQGSSTRKQKRKVEALMTNQACLLEIVANLAELQDKQ